MSLKRKIARAIAIGLVALFLLLTAIFHGDLRFLSGFQDKTQSLAGVKKTKLMYVDFSDRYDKDLIERITPRIRAILLANSRAWDRPLWF